MENIYKSNTYSTALPNYLQSQQVYLKPLHYVDLTKGLEQLASNRDSRPGDLVKGLFSDRVRTLRATVVALSDEIKSRQDLNSYLLDRVNYRADAASTTLSNLKDIGYPYFPESVNSRKERVQGDLLALEKEQRSECLECWRDVMFMKKYMNSALKDYWDLVRKRNVLEGESL